MAKKVESSQVHELLLQALETERGGIQIYTAAVQAAQNEDLRKEWEHYLEQTRNHERILTNVFAELGMDTEQSSPGREVGGCCCLSGRLPRGSPSLEPGIRA